MHELQIQLVMLVHHVRMNAVDLENVVGIGNTIRRRQFLVGRVSDERHAGSLTRARRYSIMRCHTSALPLEGPHKIVLRPLCERVAAGAGAAQRFQPGVVSGGARLPNLPDAGRPRQ